MKRKSYKFVSSLLVILIVLSTLTICLVSTAALSKGNEDLSSNYATNPNGMVGKRAKINVNGDFTGWTEDMLIAQGAAWDVANHWKGGHENCVLDTYSLYGAWDDDNLYIAWQMVNVTDTWAREGDGPLSDGGRVLDVPLILALSINENSTPMTNKVQNGDPIWFQNEGVNFTTHADTLLYMSGKPGLGQPAIFTAADDKGNTSYDEPYCKLFSKAGIEYKMNEDFFPSSLIGLDFSESPNDVFDDNADWVDYLNFTGSMGKHDTKYDSFYEIKIPLKTLNIDSNYIEQNGIGAMLVATRGESGLDCIPFDSTMIDNATEDYGSDPSTSHEKDDLDDITVPFARIGNLSGGGEIPTKPTKPTTPTTTEPTTKPTAPAEDVLYGDINLDGEVNVRDATLIQRYLVGLETFNEQQLENAMFLSGDEISVRNATQIQRYVAGLISSLV